MINKSYDIVIVGAGPTGLLAGLSFATKGFNVAVCGKLPTLSNDSLDTRTAALFNDSITMLDNLCVWPDLKHHCAQIKAIRIVDDMRHSLRGPELMFNADLLNLQTLGWNVPNASLVEHLTRANAGSVRCELILGVQVAETYIEHKEVIVKIEDGNTLRAKLLIGADGQHSNVRQTAGLSIRKIQYSQSALTTTLKHSRPHNDISTEFHRPGGPLTVVPLPGNTSSLVWVDTVENINYAMKLDKNLFETTLEEHLQGVLGGIQKNAARHQFPLSTLTANKLVAKRTALIGEAGHALPPIGAQGLNLSFRDVAILTDILAQSRKKNLDIGADSALRHYQAQRASDIRLRAWGIDVLNRSLISTWPGLHFIRGSFSHIIHSIPAIKRVLMRSGLSGTTSQPELMRQ
ncbi:MAG: Ubiquinone hydroxylase UbiL [Hyphomicrobiaceae bacterium hypho_1]